MEKEEARDKGNSGYYYTGVEKSRKRDSLVDANTLFESEIKARVVTELNTLGGRRLSNDDPRIVVERPRIENNFDFSLNCSPLAFSFGKNPAQLAIALSEKLNVEGEEEDEKIVEEVEAVGPYLNFKISRKIYQKEVLMAISQKESEYGFVERGLGRKLLLEHTSINPNASPHIGRVRNSIIGDFLVRLKRAEGYNVSAEYFVNDIGKQIALLLLGMEKYSPGREPLFEDILDMYIKINEDLKNDPDIEKRAFSILENLENGDNETRKKFRKVVDICLSGQCKLFSQLGIHFDEFTYESAIVLDTSMTSQVLDRLGRKGRSFIDEEGRICVNLKGYNIPTKNPVLVLTRSDKTSLYPLRDIAYTISKMEKSPTNNYVVLGEDQKTYMQQISAVLDILGYDAPKPIFYSFVLLRGEKMATREGKVVLLSDVMDVLKKSVVKNFQERGTRNVDIEKIEKIASSSIRYAILGTSRNKNVNFEIERILNSQGDSAVYTMYTFARISSLISKGNWGESNLDTIEICELTDLEYDIVKKLGDYYEVINAVSTSLESYPLVAYTNELCKLFSRYYSEEKILNVNDSKNRKEQKLLLLIALRQVLANSMDIIGIEKLEEF